jgi:PAS domain-containing protein
MKDNRKTKAQLIGELETLRRRVDELEQAQSEVIPAVEGWDEERRQLLSVFDSMDEPVYVCDPESYEVLYANHALRTLFGEVVGRRCHEAFQGLDAPCSFCTNARIFGESLGTTYVWEFQNRLSERWYRCIDRAIR